MVPHPGRGFLGVTRIGFFPMFLKSEHEVFFSVNSKDRASRQLLAMGSRRQAPTSTLPCSSSPWGQQDREAKDCTMTQAVGNCCQPGAVPRAGIGMALSGDPSVPALKLSSSGCQTLIIREMQAAEAGVPKTGTKASYLFSLSLCYL